MSYNKDNTAESAKIIELAEQLAGDTSSASQSSSRGVYKKLIRKVEDTVKMYRLLARKVRITKYLTHEVEWVFDNYYIVQGVVADIGQGISKKDFRKLPHVRHSDRVVPRIYFLLSELASRFDHDIDKDMLDLFINSYQKRVPLSLRELYAIPVILKIVFAEQIQRLIGELLVSLDEFAEADFWFKKISKIIRKGNSLDFSKIIYRLSSEYSTIPVAVSFHLLERLSEEGSSVRPLIKWLRYSLLKQGVRIEDLGDRESRIRNTMAEGIANTINSLRWIDQTRWDAFISEVNSIDEIFKRDPAGVYSSMDLQSQDACRKVIIQLADKTGASEADVARVVLSLAEQGSGALSPTQVSVSESVSNHVGFFLIDEGRKILEDKIGYAPGIKAFAVRSVVGYSAFFYLGSIAGISFLIASLFMLFAPETLPPYAMIVMWALGLIAGTDTAVALVNTLATRYVPIRTVPRLNFSGGIPADACTFVVVPSLFRTVESGRELAKRLEAHYLANQDGNIFYALLLDFKDAKTEEMPTDRILVESIESEIQTLNQKYPSATARFYALYRKRVWNPKQKVFMGWERKRGKLREWNELVRGSKQTSYVSNFSLESLPHIKYAITIDEDTVLPLGSAGELIGAIHHPLNRPVMLEGKVVRGYGIIQPHMSVRLAHAMKSAFSRLHVSSAGIDSYSSAVADLYQDFFGTSVFYGKGIYDIDAVEKTMKGKIPDNIVLSHDLIEGIYARTAFSSGINLFEGFPSNYYEYIVRLSRWIRGDWQVVSWLWKKDRFSAIDRWKIFDNIRRSIVPPAIFALILASWLFSESVSLWVSLFAIVVVGAPFIIGFIFQIFQLFSWRSTDPLHYRLKNIAGNFLSSIGQTLIRLVFLLFSAISAGEAILMSLWRMIVSKKNLLQWQTAHEVSAKVTGTLREFYGFLWLSQIIPFSILASDILYFKSFAPSLYFWNILWCMSPILAFVLSRSKLENVILEPSHKRFLRVVAVKTERFFLSQSTKENNYLIPDHVIPDPLSTKAYNVVSTSPTNIGMLLATLLTAHDLGHITSINFAIRLANSLATLSKLDRFKGHLYNWYDIKHLKPLTPVYVSTVDSANFLMSLIVVRQGLAEIASKKVIDDSAREGVIDILTTIRDDLQPFKPFSKKTKILRLMEKKCTESISYLESYASATPQSIQIWLTHVQQVNSEFQIELDDLKTNLGNDGTSLYSGLSHFNLVVTDIKDAWKKFLAYTEYAPMPIRSMIPTFGDLADRKVRAGVSDPTNSKLLKMLLDAEHEAERLSEVVSYCEKQCKILFDEADFSFLYNKDRGLFHIGFNTVFNKIDNSYYDLLASEANAASFVAVLKNQVPKKHWFYLGRKLVRVGQTGALSSWGGSLFEYLTSLLYYDAHPKSLLGFTARVAIQSHQRFAIQKRTPWGMGEAAYNSFDIHNNYQYQIFGEPTLGLKRGLEDRLVVAPYTSVMSLSISPQKAVANLRRLIKEGVWGIYGFYDSIDYTIKKGFFRRKGVPVKIHYAHHQGFIALAINNAINGNRIRTLFHRDPQVRATEILLEERMPKIAPVRPIKNIGEFSSDYTILKEIGGRNKQYVPIRTKRPRYALLGNGKYFVGVSNSGAGWSLYKSLSVTRYREDPLSEPWGTFFYLYDEQSKSVWSPTFKPATNIGKRQRIVFSENKAEFSHTYNKIQTTLEITVPQADNLEIRHMTLKNVGDEPRELLLASFAELVMTRQKDDISHSSFQKLLIQSKVLPEYEAVIFERRDVQQNQKPLYSAHFISSASKGETAYIRNREDFVQGSDSLALPGIFEKGIQDESLTPSYTLDPIMSIAKKVELAPGQTLSVSYMTAAADSYDELLKTIKKYRKQRVVAGALASSDDHSKKSIADLGMSVQQALLFQKFISTIFSASWHPHRMQPSAHAEPLIRSLWQSGISGDMPYIVVRVKDIQDIPIIKSLLLFYKYVLFKGLAFDIIILNEYPTSYIKILDDEIDFLLRISKTDEMLHAQGKIFHLKADLMSQQDKDSILYLARVVIDAKNGTFEQQLEKLDKTKVARELPPLLQKKKAFYQTRDLEKPKGLLLENTIGGFDAKRREYVIMVTKDSQPRAPWVNFLANPSFGSIVNHRGGSFTWSEDSYDNRLTSFHPDALAEKGSEIFYIRDEETGDVWNPTPLAIRKSGAYIVRHGQGYSIFEHSRQGIQSTLSLFVPLKGKLKIYTLSLKNTSNKIRKISATTYHEMILGVDREGTKHDLGFERTSDNVMVAKNIVRNHFNDRLVFLDFNSGDNQATIHRDEFIGRYGDYYLPEALKRTSLSGNIGYTAENCVALQAGADIAPGGQKDFVLIVGEAENEREMQEVLKVYRQKSVAEKSLEDVKQYWKDVQPYTLTSPDTALDVLFNNYALYQLLSSRIFAKTGYYQPGGAFGFRDMLQDAMALTWSDPAHARSLIVKAAEHQFAEGDVMNWWHEHNNFGTRTLFSDQHLWLPYVVEFYAKNTGDYGLLDEKFHCVSAPPLVHGVNMQWTGIPEKTQEKFSMYEHCVRALDYSLRFGHNGLPLIGAGDWNDGLNRTGQEGRGESVWLGWFMYKVFSDFKAVCSMKGDHARVERNESMMRDLKVSLDKAWDGAWYRRAYLDNGLPLGSAVNGEFKIDSIAQSWSALSGAGMPDKVERALRSAKERLITAESVRLLTPPLERSSIDPGYIKNYPPGVRENGAQYNHAALWLAQAYFSEGDSATAMQIINLVNPFIRAKDKKLAEQYRVEPYVIAGDIYASPSYEGRGGWTWYTGSAGILYRTVLEYIVGIAKKGDELSFNPCMPSEWPEVKIEFAHRSSSYIIVVSNPERVARGVISVSCDGENIESKKIKLTDDGKKHVVEVVLGKAK